MALEYCPKIVDSVTGTEDAYPWWGETSRCFPRAHSRRFFENWRFACLVSSNLNLSYSRYAIDIMCRYFNGYLIVAKVFGWSLELRLPATCHAGQTSLSFDSQETKSNESPEGPASVPAIYRTLRTVVKRGITSPGYLAHCTKSFWRYVISCPIHR